MSKQEFLAQLRKGLSGLPQQDTEERLLFYSEMIDDLMEEGISEEDAVSEIGNIDELISQIVADIPLYKLVKDKVTPKYRLKAWEIVLLVLGSPVWLSLGIAAAAVILSVYVSLWSVIISLWAVFVSFAVCAIGGLIAGIVFVLGGNSLTGIAMIGAGIVCTGISVFMILGCLAATKGIVVFTKKLAMWIKNFFIKKEEIK